MNVLSFETPLGFISIYEQDGFIVALKFQKNFIQKTSEILEICKKQILEYFEGKRKIFDCPLKIIGTDFQKKVLLQTLKIPYGQTATYKEIAQRIGKPKSYRAVALALKNNKLPILIPCHRVIGSDGALKGYSSGLEKKRFLLQLETDMKLYFN